MNPRIAQLRTYPFTRLADRLRGIEPPATLPPLLMHIGAPRHAPPDAVAQRLAQGRGLGNYPPSLGDHALRQSCVDALTRRYRLDAGWLDADAHIVPVNGTREGLFAFVQAMSGGKANGLIAMPNPFYQIYEGAAILAGAEPYYLNTQEEHGYLPDLRQVPESVWRRCEVLFLCSPGNPSGTFMSADDWRLALELADHYDFVIAADECYADIYREHQAPPTGLLEVCAADGRRDLARCAVFHSLSKRSNVPGLRSGFIAGDATLIEALRRYRAYHGCAMSQTVQDASIWAWNDDSVPAHNRAQYDQKYREFARIVSPHWSFETPPGAFYLWLNTPGDDRDFVRALYAEQNVKLLPGQYLARDAHGTNPGKGRVRISLVPTVEECREAAHRIVTFLDGT